MIVPKNKNNARHTYGNGNQGRLPYCKMPKNLSNVQSKIKDQVAYFKTLSKDQGNRQMFNKDPIVYANPHPAEQDYGYMNNQRAAVQKNASLRVRSDMAPQQQQQEPQPQLHSSITPSEEPSSSVIDARGSQASYPDRRFQNLPNRSDLSPSGITSGIDERESPYRYQDG